MNFKVNSTLKKADRRHCGAALETIWRHVYFHCSSGYYEVILPSESLVFLQFVSTFLFKPEGIICLR